MTDKFEYNNIEYIKLKGDNLELAKEYDDSIRACYEEEKEINARYEHEINLLKSKIVKKRKDTLMKILLDLGYDASKCSDGSFDINAAFGKFGLAVLIRNKALDPDDDIVSNPSSTKH